MYPANHSIEHSLSDEELTRAHATRSGNAYREGAMTSHGGAAILWKGYSSSGAAWD
jgi:hypothetical protein